MPPIARSSGCWRWAVILVFAVLIAYQPAWRGKPIWDDPVHITKSELRTVQGLARIWTEPGAAQQYYPLTHTVFWVEHRLFGDGTLGYHLVNILLHAFCALLLTRILQRLEVPGAWFAAAIFALHPVHVESVAWISELKNTLSGVFYLSSALAYLRFQRFRNVPLYALALGLFLLGLMSKTVVATLPVALLLISWWKFKKLAWARDVMPLMPFLVAGIGFGLFTARMEHKFFIARAEQFDFSFIERCLIAGRAIWFYLAKLFWPSNLTFIYPRWEISQSVWWQYLFPLSALLLVAVLWCQRRRWPAMFVAAIFFPVTLFPALGFIHLYPFLFSFVADHFQYLASIGPIALASAGLTIASDTLAKTSALLRRLCLGAFLLLLGILTWRQSSMYADIETLWRTTIARNPGCWLAYNNLGVVLQQRDQLDDAIALYDQALRMNPSFAEPHKNLATILQGKGHLDEAIAHYQEAIRIDPDDAGAHNAIGIILQQSGRLDDAIAQYDQATKVDPDFAEAHFNLGAVLYQSGRLDEAFYHFERAVKIKPNDAQVRYVIGNLFRQAGRLDEAIAQYREALKLQPDFAKAQDDLDSTLEEKSRLDQPSGSPR